MRLIDADRLKRQVEGRSWRAKGKMVELIDNSPTIRVGENTCKHRTPDGVCKLYTDEHFTSFCVDGPCPNEEPITEDEAPEVKHRRWIPASERLPERPHGQWEQYKDDCWSGGGFTKCSACGYGFAWGAFFETEEWEFCPICGAMMDLEGDAHEQN